MKISKEFMLREIAGEYIVVPTGQAVFQFTGLITVNEVGAFLWSLLQKQECTLEYLTQMLCQEYEVEEQCGKKDVSEFLEALKSRGVLV